MLYDNGRDVLKTYQIQERRSSYTTEQKSLVASSFISTGSLRKTSLVTGVPLSTIHGWAHSDWWQTLSDSLRTQYRAELEAKIRTIVFQNLEQLADRLANGDVAITKGGNVIRHPIKARDLVFMMGTMFDKHKALVDALSHVPNGDSQLVTLAERLAMISTAKGLKAVSCAKNTSAKID